MALDSATPYLAWLCSVDRMELVCQWESTRRSSWSRRTLVTYRRTAALPPQAHSKELTNLDTGVAAQSLLNSALADDTLDDGYVRMAVHTSDTLLT